VAHDFLSCDGEQELPPSLREWLVLDAVDTIDLSAFYSA
jgi:hypothetical protein